MSIITPKEWRITRHQFLRDADVAQNATDMALDRGYLFTPKRAPLALPDGTIPTTSKGRPMFHSVYREMPDGSQRLLNPAVGDGFAISGYDLLTQTVDALFPESTIDMKLIEDGRRIMIRVRPSDPVTIHGDDRLSMEILFVASLDNGWKTAAYGTTYRYYCANQMRLADIAFGVKRTRNHDGLLFNRSLIMARATEQFGEFAERARYLTNVQVDRWQYMRIMDTLMPRPVGKDGKEPHGKAIATWEKRRSGVDYFWQVERDRCGWNGWALIQAIQSYEFHTKTKEDVRRQVDHIIDPAKHEPLTRRVLQMI